MSTPKDGGAAFPTLIDLQAYGMGNGSNLKPITSGGLTVRDYFAAKAMQGWLASFGDQAVHPCAPGEDGQPRAASISVAELSYSMADALLAQREKNGG